MPIDLFGALVTLPTLPTPTNLPFPSHAAMLVEVDKLVAEGWTKLPLDLPEQGVIGYTCFRQTGTVEEVRSFEWHPFGQITPNVTLIDRNSGPETARHVISEMLTKFRGKQVFQAGDAKNRLLGFGYYEDGKANILRVPLTLFIGLGIEELKTVRDSAVHMRSLLCLPY